MCVYVRVGLFNHLQIEIKIHKHNIQHINPPKINYKILKLTNI